MAAAQLVSAPAQLSCRSSHFSPLRPEPILLETDAPYTVPANSYEWLTTQRAHQNPTESFGDDTLDSGFPCQLLGPARMRGMRDAGEYTQKVLCIATIHWLFNSNI